MCAKKVGTVSKEVIEILGLDNVNVDTPIYLGDSNIEHMRLRHLNDYLKIRCRYFDDNQ